MPSPAILSLFTGYGGLDMAVQAVTGGHLVAVSDIDPGPCRVAEHYHPDIPNLGDMTALDIDSLPEFSVLTGGYPCQPFSLAGRRKGTDDTRHLWPHVLQVIQTRRPAQVFLENVRGHLTLGFSDVLRDLSEAGYIVRWSIMAASSVGAPHRRERLYIYATPGESAGPATVIPSRIPTAGVLDADGLHVRDRVDHGVKLATAGLLPTPVARDHKGMSIQGREGGPSLGDIPRLLPTPQANLGSNGGGQHPDKRREGGHSVSIEDVALGLGLDHPGTDPYGEWDAFNTPAWGAYAQAVARWSLITGNPVPAPVEPNKNGRPRLTASLVEWMMGLSPGYLTSPELGLSRAVAIKLGGNGVVPQAAATAYPLIMAL